MKISPRLFYLPFSSEGAIGSCITGQLSGKYIRNGICLGDCPSLITRR